MTAHPPAETAAAFVPDGDLGQYLLSALDDPAELTGRLCAIESVSGNEGAIAEAVVTVLEAISAGDGPDLEILRDGDTIVARTGLGRPERIVIAGHLDTVPVEGNLPPRRLTGEVGESRESGVENGTDSSAPEDEAPAGGAPTEDARESGASERDQAAGEEIIWGRGACDMKAGVAMRLAAASAPRNPSRDVSWVFYDHEEVDAALNGLGRVARTHPGWLAGDFAILGEPSNASVEGGRNGTIRVDVTTTGVRAHSARAFMGVNAIHAAAEVLTRLDDHVSETVTVDGLDYRESLSAVAISGEWPATSCPMSAASPSTTASRPRSPPRRPRASSASSSPASTSSSPTPPKAPAPDSTAPSRRTSSPRSARNRRRSSDGPTSPGSVRSASRR